MMNKYRIRHLPVLEGGELVGIVSQRDLYFVETLGDTPPAEIRVEEAMTTDVFVTSRDASLADVVRTMIKRKLGCAVVTRAGNVIGVFSAIDGLKALLHYAPS
jgi:acetoin utilization protein AcuB